MIKTNKNISLFKDIEGMEKVHKSKINLLEIVRSTCEVADDMVCKLNSDVSYIEEDINIKVIDNIQEPVVVLDVSGYIIHSNTKVQELLSLSKEELSRYHILKLLAEYSKEFEQNINFEIILEKYSENFNKENYIVLDKHPQDIKYVSLSTSEYNTKEGKLWFVFIRNKTDLVRKQKENKTIKNRVKIYEEVLESFTVSNNEMLVAIDKEWNVVYYNNSYKEKLKKIFDINVKIGDNLKSYITNIKETSNDNVFAIESWKKCLLGKACTDESQFNRSNKEYSFLNTFIPIYDDAKNIIGAIQTIKELTPTLTINVAKKQKVKSIAKENL